MLKSKTLPLDTLEIKDKFKGRRLSLGRALVYQIIFPNLYQPVQVNGTLDKIKKRPPKTINSSN